MRERIGQRALSRLPASHQPSLTVSAMYWSWFEEADLAPASEQLAAEGHPRLLAYVYGRHCFIRNGYVGTSNSLRLLRVQATPTTAKWMVIESKGHATVKAISGLQVYKDAQKDLKRWWVGGCTGC